MPADATREYSEVAQWYRDPVSCLQSTLATVLIHAGEDPLAALGRAWEFRYLPGDVRPEEFYWPCRVPGDLARSVLPHVKVTSRWQALHESDPLSPWQEALERGELPIIVVDNYHLPFRPAYHDVHAAHLLVLRAVDRDSGTVHVSDAMPPAFQGALAVEDLLRACDSPCPPDHQDRFFSGQPVGGRWLQVRVDAPSPPLTRQRLREVLAENLRGFTQDGTTPTAHWSGLDGLRRYRDLLARAVRAGAAPTLGEVYTHGWSQQSQAALHGELLRRCGSAWQLSRLSEAGRRVEQVAHSWTAVRVSAAHWSASPLGPGKSPERLLYHFDRLSRCYEVALTAVGEAMREL
ncbi:BtrH N-terminal domain-containing protein [Streptomyces sp. MP131-18]|uniref:BtrH N-terminal domain-containing protein n=1 Tax=Streptomyces sp. MP131-18 TaxID=1857892 RepID=UPI00097C75E2|nr:BtrH N-terminal domain-containing protein [Streptomyces sp. MP131-18]ONK10461.1 hypothetical protein STBA_11830 [Streptomyces sp. MP131-18]